MFLYVATSSRSASAGISASVFTPDALAQRVQLVLEVLAIDLQHDVGVHLDEAAVGVEREALVAGRRARGPARSRR